MPYKLIHKNKCWKVINTKSGAVKSKCTTERKAKSQIRLLYSIDSRKGGSRKCTNNKRSAKYKRNNIKKPFSFPRKFCKEHCLSKSCKRMGFTERSSCAPWKKC